MNDRPAPLASWAPASRVHGRAWIALAGIVAVGAALRFHSLGTQATWADEVCRTFWAKGYEPIRYMGFLPSETAARRPVRDLEHALTVINAHDPPLNGIVLNVWMRAAGSDSDLVARLPSAIFSVLAIVAMFLATRAALGAAVAGWAAALVALSPFHVYYAQEVNHYALVTCLVAFSFFFYYRFLERPGARDGVGLFLTGTAALYTHYFAAIVLLCQGAGLLVRYGRKPRLLARATLPYLAMAAAFAPYLPTFSGQLGVMTAPSMVGIFAGWRYLGHRLLDMAAVAWLGEQTLPFGPAVAVPLLALYVAMLIYGVRLQQDRVLRRVLLVNALGPVVVVAVFFWVARSNSIVWPRYQLMFTFAQLMPVAAALQRGSRWRWAAVASFAVLAVVGFRFLFADLVKEDWKGAAAAIASTPSTEENVIVYRANLTYSLGRYLEPEHRLFGVGSEPDLRRRLALASDGRRATWFVSAWAVGSEVPAAVHAFLACRYAQRRDYPVDPGRVGLTVTRYSEPRSREEQASIAACATAPEATPLRERASAGALVEGGTIDTPSEAGLETYRAARAVTVTGWTFSTGGIRALTIDLDGVEALRTPHPGLTRPDVAAAYSAVPTGYTMDSGYWAIVDVSRLAAGVHTLRVAIERADGSIRRIGDRQFVLASLEPHDDASLPITSHRGGAAR